MYMGQCIYLYSVQNSYGWIYTHIMNTWWKYHKWHGLSKLFCFFCFFYRKVIIHQSVKLTDAVWLLQLVISSPLIHAFGDLSQAPTGIRAQLERRMTFQLSYPSPFLLLAVKYYYNMSHIILVNAENPFGGAQEHFYYNVYAKR